MRPISRALATVLAVAPALFPTHATGQLVIRDDVAGWGWLTFQPNRRAVASLGYANPVTAVQGRLNPQLLEDLAAKGVGRVFDAGTFDAAVSQVVVECTATDRTPPNATEVNFAVHAEVSYWDHARLAAAEIYESMILAAVPPTQFRPDTYVQACSAQVANVLIRLGFTPD